MRRKLETTKESEEILEKIKDSSGENVFACYQCGKCSAACPATEQMDMLPNQIIRRLQLGMVEEVLESKTPWSCASCLECMSICPKGVDLSKIMEAIRLLHLRAGTNEISIRDFDEDYKKRAPQIAFISGYRKFLSLS
jgi:heterodisulfide reductase subunit C